MGANDSMYSELVLGLNGGLKEHAEFQALFELTNDAVDAKDSTKKSIAFATAKHLAETRFDLLDGSKRNLATEEVWTSKEDGWLLVARDTNGWSFWFNPEWDEFFLLHNYSK